MSTAVPPQTDYSGYLRIDDLLNLQHPLTPGAHDEMLFIVIHQAFELWFKEMLHELRAARDSLLSGSVGGAVPLIKRVVAIDELLIQQLRVLETMGPEGFMKFRDPLAPASGFQSTQFREIEHLCGVGNVRGDEPTLWEGVCSGLQQNGLDMPSGSEPADVDTRIATLRDLYRDHKSGDRALMHQLCEALVDHDEALSRWRFHHSLMAEREIGMRQGTGGSSGVRYLQGTIAGHCFPELWSLRNDL